MLFKFIEMIINLTLIISIFLIIIVPRKIIINEKQFYIIFLFFNTFLYFINMFFFKIYLLNAASLFFSAPLLYFLFYMKINLGILNVSILKPHLAISIVLLILFYNYSKILHILFTELIILIYFFYYIYLLFQLLFENYKQIIELFKNSIQTIHNAIIISFVFYFTFLICFINLIFSHKYFNIFFLVYFIMHNVIYFWKTTKFKFIITGIHSSNFIIEKESNFKKLTPLKINSNIVNFSLNWIIKPDTLKSCDEKIIINIEPFLNNYFEKLDAIHIETYNTFFNSPELSMLDFANECNIPINHLRFLFKYYSKVSFHEFKRMCQIKNALHLIDNQYLKKETFESLSKKTGFLSYSSFYINFKKHTNLLPLEYLKRN